jgi:hypothetical protein
MEAEGVLMHDERERESRLERLAELAERAERERPNGAKPDYSGCSELAVALMRRAFQFKSGRFSREFVARDFQRIIEEHGT